MNWNDLNKIKELILGYTEPTIEETDEAIKEALSERSGISLGDFVRR